MQVSWNETPDTTKTGDYKYTVNVKSTNGKTYTEKVALSVMPTDSTIADMIKATDNTPGNIPILTDSGQRSQPLHVGDTTAYLKAHATDYLVGVDQASRYNIDKSGKLQPLKIVWESVPDVSKPGTSDGTVRVTYADYSFQEINIDGIEVADKVKHIADDYNPGVQPIKDVTVGTIPDVKINNGIKAGSIPSDAKVAWDSDAVNIFKNATADQAGQTVNATAIVTYSDNSTDKVTIPVTFATKALTDAEKYKAIAKPLTDVIAGPDNPYLNVGYETGLRISDALLPNFITNYNELKEKESGPIYPQFAWTEASNEELATPANAGKTKVLKITVKHESANHEYSSTQTLKVQVTFLPADQVANVILSGVDIDNNNAPISSFSDTIQAKIGTKLSDIFGITEILNNVGAGHYTLADNTQLDTPIKSNNQNIQLKFKEIVKHLTKPADGREDLTYGSVSDADMKTISTSSNYSKDFVREIDFVDANGKSISKDTSNKVTVKYAYDVNLVTGKITRSLAGSTTLPAYTITVPKGYKPVDPKTNLNLPAVTIKLDTKSIDPVKIVIEKEKDSSTPSNPDQGQSSTPSTPGQDQGQSSTTSTPDTNQTPSTDSDQNQSTSTTPTDNGSKSDSTMNNGSSSNGSMGDASVSTSNNAGAAMNNSGSAEATQTAMEAGQPNIADTKGSHMNGTMVNTAHGVQFIPKSNNAKTLPQTGEKQNNAGIFGLALAGIASFFGLAADRKRRN